MQPKYTRLKLTLLLWVLLGTLAALALGALALELLVDGIFQDPFARLFLWVAEGLFGQSNERSLELYYLWVQDKKIYYVGGAIVVLMLAACWLAMGTFTRWLAHISAAVHQVAEDSRQNISLPRQLAPLQADLTALQTTLRRRQEEARESEQRKNDLLVFLAHDLKTPLTSVIGYLTLLQDNPGLSAGERAKYTGIALDKALRLEELLVEFFAITRESLHETPAESAPIDLSMLLEQLADEFYPQFQDKGLTCSAAISPHLSVSGDGDKLARVFDNVLRNAVHYSNRGGRVEIEAARQGGQILITIRNEGLPIPEQELANIFLKFYRLDSARSTRTGGAGLGLAIAKEIVEAHGGAIRAESNARNTAFIITLPALPSPSRPMAVPPPPLGEVK